MSDNELLAELWHAGVKAVRGREAVSAALDAAPIQRPDAILAVGKAAASMAEAAADRFGQDVPMLVLTKYGHAQGADLPPEARVIEAAHPVPDAESLRAGEAALTLVSGMDADSHLLLLVSGGASALVEVPEHGLTLDDLARENARLLAEGLDIHAMNRRRRELSRVKGGRLLAAFPGARATTLAISDVEGDDLMVIGSGIGAAPPDPAFVHDARIVASNAIARRAVCRAAEKRGLTVLSSEEALYDDVYLAAARIVAGVDGIPGLRVWGGEPTVRLPANPGEGGRNQSLALILAQLIAGHEGVTALVAGTDGTDGPTDAAGGIVDGRTWGPGAQGHLDRADAGPFLRSRDALFTTGPTGTNVMDLALVLQR